MFSKEYYRAYDDRYRQIHQENLQWSSKNPTEIVEKTMEKLAVSPYHKVLEIGCGEGRDALVLLEKGFDVLATDVSAEAVRYCQSKAPAFSEHFQILDCVKEKLPRQFDFIYAVSVVHMLVEDGDRDGFYRFIHEHLKSNGHALICTMGDGSIERQSDVRTAFDIQERTHQQTGKKVQVAATSCRMINFQTFEAELRRNGLDIVDRGITSAEPDFSELMYAIVKKRDMIFFL